MKNQSDESSLNIFRQKPGLSPKDNYLRSCSAQQREGEGERLRANERDYVSVESASTEFFTTVGKESVWKSQ